MVDSMFKEFLEICNYLVIVFDEFNNVVGVVIIEDVFEEIVGEILDESDKEEDMGIFEVLVVEYEVLGFVYIDEINEYLGMMFFDLDDFDMIVGLVLSYCNEIF